MRDDTQHDRLSEVEREDAFLSALLDGETDELELRRFLKDAEHPDQAHIEKLGRYAFASALLHDEAAAIALTDKSFVASVSAAISSESLDGDAASTQMSGESASQANRSSLSASLGKFAIAASVAMAVVLGSQFDTLTGNSPVQQNVSTQTALNAPVSQPGFTDLQAEAEARVAELKLQALDVYPHTAARDLAKASLETEQRERINSLLRFHYEQSAANGSRGMIPVARITTVDDQR